LARSADKAGGVSLFVRHFPQEPRPDRFITLRQILPGMTGLSDFEYLSTIISRLNPRLENLCHSTGTRYLREVYEAVEDPEMQYALRPELTSDGAHFNYTGYEVIGRALCAALENEVEKGESVVLLGDSITAGYPEYEPLLMGENYGDERHSFGYFLRTVLGLKVANKGISGDLTTSMVRRMDEYMVPPPDMVIFQGGANDAFNSLPFRKEQRTRERATGMAGLIYNSFNAMVGNCTKKGARGAVIPLLPFHR